jgi:hypothetical protein
MPGGVSHGKKWQENFNKLIEWHNKEYYQRIMADWHRGTTPSPRHDTYVDSVRVSSYSYDLANMGK